MQSIAASEVALRRVAGQDQALWNGMGGGGDRGGGGGRKSGRVQGEEWFALERGLEEVESYLKACAVHLV